jgi:hypothetical protein
MSYRSTYSRYADLLYLVWGFERRHCPKVGGAVGGQLIVKERVADRKRATPSHGSAHPDPQLFPSPYTGAPSFSFIAPAKNQTNKYNSSFCMTILLLQPNNMAQNVTRFLEK